MRLKLHPTSCHVPIRFLRCDRLVRSSRLRLLLCVDVFEERSAPGEIEEAFRNLKGDLSIRPIHHQKEKRIEAHIFISFLSYCLHVTIRQRLKTLGGGLTPRELLRKFSAIQMMDVHLPTTDGRTIQMSRYTQPNGDRKLLLSQLKLKLPAQSPPKIYAKESTPAKM